MKKKIKNIVNNKFLLFTIVFFVINILLLLSIIMVKYEHFGNYEKKFFAFITLLELICFIIYYFVFKKDKNIKLEKIYLMMIIPIGLLYLSFFPINTVPDEIAHFFRAYEISGGHLISVSNEEGAVGRYYTDEIGEGLMSIEDYHSLKKALNVKKTTNTHFYRFDSSALYSFVSYLPQAIGIFVGRVLNCSIIVQAYLGRLFAFALFVFLSYLSIKIIPSKKLALFVLFFNPMLLQEVISLATDCITISVTAFLFSYILYLKNKKEKINKKQVAILCLLSIVLSLCKIVYLPICLLVLLIPKEKFDSKKKKIIISILIIALATVANLVWLSISSKFLPSNGEINSKEQLLFILRNPLKYIVILVSTYKQTGFSYMLQSFGCSLGYGKALLSNLGIIIYIIITLMIMIFDNEDNNKNNVNKIEQWFIIGIIFVIIMLISTSLYLQWTPLRSLDIRGIQGRYFIPLYILLPYIFTKFTIKPKINFHNKYLYFFLISYNLYVLSEIFFAYM